MNDRILRSPAPSGQRILKQEQFDAVSEAAGIVDQARREAAAILEQAGEELDLARKQAGEAGYEDGLRQWNQAVQDILAARDRFLKDCEPEVVKLAVRVAEKILGEQLRVDPQAITRIVEEALRGARAERSITIAVHPDSVAVVRAEAGRLEARAGGECRVHIIGRGTVSPGGCVIETELGSIDARLEVQLRCLEQLLLRELGG
jgi:type III secretion protein L